MIEITYKTSPTPEDIEEIKFTSRHNNTITIKEVSKNTEELYISKSNGIVISKGDAVALAMNLLQFAKQREACQSDGTKFSRGCGNCGYAWEAGGIKRHEVCKLCSNHNQWVSIALHFRNRGNGKDD